MPQLKKTDIKTVEFPEQDESSGEITVGLLGPNCMDPEAIAALDVMNMYLAGSSVSVLEKELVEIKEPWASSVQIYTDERPDTVLWFQLTSVETEKLEAAEKKLFEVLKKTASNPLNLEYMRQLLRRQKRQKIFFTESSESLFSRLIITDHLFGTRDGKQLIETTATVDAYDALEKWTEPEWRAFLNKWYVDRHHVSVLGRPSAAMAKRLEEDDKTRVEKRVKDLGEAGLKKLQEKLDAAKAENDREIPAEVIGQFKVPSVDSIPFIKTTTARGGLAKKAEGPGRESSGVEVTPAQNIIDRDNVDLPLYLHFESVPTKFVHLSLYVSTASIPVKLRPLVPIYFENFFNSPVMKDGVRIEYENVVEKLEEDTVAFSIEDAGPVDLSEEIRIRFQIEPEKYEAAIAWIKTLLWDVIFDTKRIEVFVAKIRSDIPDEKREGNSMSASVTKMIQLAPESIGRAKDTLVKSKYMKRIDALLKEDPKEVIRQLEEFRDAFARLENFHILVIADLNVLKNPVSAWKSFVAGKPFVRNASKFY